MRLHPGVRIKNAPLGRASLARPRPNSGQQLFGNIASGDCKLANFLFRRPAVLPHGRTLEVKLVPGSVVHQTDLIEPFDSTPQCFSLLFHLHPVLPKPRHHKLETLIQLVKGPQLLGSQAFDSIDRPLPARQEEPNFCANLIQSKLMARKKEVKNKIPPRKTVPTLPHSSPLVSLEEAACRISAFVFAISLALPSACP